MSKKKIVFAALASGLMGMAASASATEGGGGVYPNGNEGYMVGAMPPPGFYAMAYAGSYNSDSLMDNNGNKFGPPNFNVRANFIAPRAIWVTQQTVLGGSLAFHTIIPLLDLSVTAGPSQSKSGMGDVTVGVGLGYHASPNFHYTFGFDINAPTGTYNKLDLANLGRNYWNYEPVAAFTYVQPEGINADLKVMYDFNRRNGATNYKSGDELHADYDLGWGFGNGFVAGVGGYVYRQTSDDDIGGAAVANSRGKAMAIGPSIKYDDGKGWFITAKYQMESSVANRAKGNEFKLKTTIPF